MPREVEGDAISNQTRLIVPVRPRTTGTDASRILTLPSEQWPASAESFLCRSTRRAMRRRRLRS